MINLIKLLIFPDNIINMSDLTNFFFYKIKAIDAAKKDVPIGEILKSKNFMNAVKSIIISDTAQKKLIYEFQFKELEEDFYYGKIVRTKDNTQFFTKKEEKMGSLEEKLDEDERVGDKEMDISRFILRIEKSELTILMQVGSRTAGIGRFKEFLKELFGDEYDIYYSSVSTEKVTNALNLFKNKIVKKIRLKFRKNPELPDNLGMIDDALKVLKTDITTEYTIDIEMSLGKHKKNETFPIFGQFYQKLFNKPINPDEIDIDFPSFLVNFDVEVISEIGGVPMSEDILDRYEKVSVKLDKLSIVDDEDTASYLLHQFKEKMGLVEDEE